MTEPNTPAPAPAAPKAATPAPAPGAKIQTPMLDRFTALKGCRATEFFKANKTALLAESWDVSKAATKPTGPMIRFNENNR